MKELPIWANLVHLSYNFWNDRPDESDAVAHITAQPYLRFDDSLWNDMLAAMQLAGMNMVVLDLGDAVRYESHPEICVEGAWSRERLCSELDKMRVMGLEPIPKLNFSTAHDIWLKEYERMVSTPKYYEVVRDLIRETLALFDNPRFLHLGMDEENASNQRPFSLAVMRQHELWWHDLYLMFDEVERGGARPWVWSDHIWYQPEEFAARMPKSVVQSNWYYGTEFDPHSRNEGHDYGARQLRAYLKLAELGYDQVLTGSNFYATALPHVMPAPPSHKPDGTPWQGSANFDRTVEWAQEALPLDNILGFMAASWHPTLESHRDWHLQAIEEVRLGREIWRN